MAKCYSLQEIPKLQKRSIFFDANILIYVFWPTGSFQWENSYSSAFGRLCKQKNQLLVDFTVVSEIINKAVRSEYEKFIVSNTKDKNRFPFKRYRDTTDGQQALNDIYLIVRDTILPKFDVYGKIFSKPDIESFLKVDTLDFSDKAIVKLCNTENFVLITNDKDFLYADIDLLTSNPAYFKNSR